MVPEDFFGARPVEITSYLFIFWRILSRYLDFFFFFTCVTEETLNTSTYSGWNKTWELEEWLDEV